MQNPYESPESDRHDLPAKERPGLAGLQDLAGTMMIESFLAWAIAPGDAGHWLGYALLIIVAVDGAVYLRYFVLPRILVRPQGFSWLVMALKMATILALTIGFSLVDSRLLPR